MPLLDFPIIELDTTDSTNNYAMHLLDADKAQFGLTIVARSQTGGKGQRGKTWIDAPGQSLLMSVITAPKQAITAQFVFSASVALAVANVLQKVDGIGKVSIKWPNDIIINDKKAGGILIENILRGSKWTYSVVGIGINVKQDSFPGSLPFATSLKMAAGHAPDIALLRNELRDAILACSVTPAPDEKVISEYNERLYKRGLVQGFSNHEGEWEAKILGVKADGALSVQFGNVDVGTYYHGQVRWEWSNNIKLP